MIASLVAGQNENGKLLNVLYVPSLTLNLLSVVAVNASGHIVVFDGRTCQIDKDTSVVAKDQLYSSLYCLNTISVGCSDTAHAALVTGLNVWHQRLAHVSVDGISALVQSGAVNGINVNKEQNVSNFRSCIYGNSTLAPIPQTSIYRFQTVLDLVHLDVCDPLQAESLGASRYFT